MVDIIKEITGRIPEGKISLAVFEAANIVLYTKDEEFLKDDNGLIKSIVDDIKKRIELRPDPSICMDLEKAKKLIESIIPEEASLTDMIFDPQRSQVKIEVEKIGAAIGKQGDLLKEIRDKTLWVPIIQRTPPLKSQIIEDIRAVLYENSDERRKFLNRIGHRIYDGWIRGKKNEWIRVSYLGGGRQVGRSAILLQTPESRVLLDCGINMANDDKAYPYLEAPEFKIEELDAVIITHSHLDHSGLLPYLFKFGYDGPVYCTEPTRDIMALLQLDFMKIQRNEGKDPLYGSDEIKKMVKNTICLKYNAVTDITPDVRITMYNAGHMLGSAMIHLHVGNGLHNLLYTGDLKYGHTNLLEPAATRFPRLETLMIESTYGGKENVMPPLKNADEEFLEYIRTTLKRGGKVLIPVLGSGRAQEVMMILDKAIHEEKIEKVPIYIDGMVWDITAIHTAYPEFLNYNVRNQIFHKDANPFLCEQFSKVGSAKERRGIIEDEGPSIVLATSGMLTGGPSVEYFKGLAENKNNTLIFSCYQPEGSLGWRVRGGEKEIAFNEGNKSEVTVVKMEIVKLEITGHADRKQLMNFISRCDPRPRKVLINHGESSRSLDFASSIHKTFKIETIVPRNLDSIRIR